MEMPVMEQHPVAKIVPETSQSERSALRNDLTTRGLLVPIVLYEGMVLDGWTRYGLCMEEGIEPQFVEYEGDDPQGFVVAMNLHRRHLTLAQKNEIARAILAEHPERTNRSIARDTGLTHETVVRRREEIEDEIAIAPAQANGEIRHYDEAESAPVERMESTGKKARGRKPLSRDERKARQPKPLTSARDSWIDVTVTEIKKDFPRNLEALVALLDGYQGVIQQKVSADQRRALVEKFAHALGIEIDEWHATSVAA